MTKLLLIRHGQSEGNLRHVFLGHTNLDLTPQGYKQAEVLTEYLKNEKIDKVYSSDLMRACHTVSGIAEQRGLEIIKDPQLREIFAGDWEGKSFDYLRSEYADEYNKWKTGIGNAVCVGGESVIELQKRFSAEIEKIVAENPGKTVCIGTHATPIRVLNAYINKIPANEIKNIPWAPNASITTVLCENGKMSIESYGFNDYLGDNITQPAD